ncbi:capsule-associated protein CAP1 [Steccherinum ochraceum]|uniref:Capsule-associated protein CAP1 n=1 Tax=Steccherinum ochraceum TaxID=92696 RepID=A0A4R0RHR7_9APHY|nr:capsule-associated protein CAP1 [Steccherinum ochraceum]
MHEIMPGRKRGIFFVVAVCAVFMQAGLWAGRKQTQNNFPDNTLVSSSKELIPFMKLDARPKIKEHPIPHLMAEAENNFRKLLSRQSKTLEEAVREYRRRYRRDPPRGFDHWWQFVKDNDVLMIDEYDAIAEDLAPFWELPADEVRRRADVAGSLPSIDLVRVRNGNATAVNVRTGSTEVSARARGFLSMIEKFQDRLPDVDFPINSMAEGRILVPWEQRMKLNESGKSFHSRILVHILTAIQGVSPHNSVGLYTSFRASSTTQRQTNQLLAQTHEFSFPESVSGNYSFCENPWAHYNQGHFFSDWRTVSVLFPVFSPAKASGYLDIRIPSHYYYAQTRRYTYGWDPVNLELKPTDHMETAWEQKSDKIFWRGASTGGGSSPPGFSANYQRHRFVRMASDDSTSNRTVVFADPPGSNNYVYVQVPTSALNEEMMDVAFVKVVDSFNYPGGIGALIRDHRFDDGGVNLGDHWRHKYLVDVDGMGYSGRFFSFLESDSAVMKATVYREFFEEWIQPWLHYIPLSPSYQEIYNIHSFFSGATRSALAAANSTALRLPPVKRRPVDGDRRLRRIARAGKQWKRTLGRRVDMEAYVYRLVLEYVRVSSEDREEWNFVL